MIIIITGDRGAGKTTVIFKLIDNLKKTGLHPEGILTPAVYSSGGGKNGFDAFDIETEKRWPLGRSDIPLDGPSYGPFSFSRSGFDKANRILRKALKTNSGPVFLDEIGPLEMRRDKGFSEIIPLIYQRDDNAITAVVVRPELIEEFMDNSTDRSLIRVVSINNENRDLPLRYIFPEFAEEAPD